RRSVAAPLRADLFQNIAQMQSKSFRRRIMKNNCAWAVARCGIPVGNSHWMVEQIKPIIANLKYLAKFFAIGFECVIVSYPIVYESTRGTKEAISPKSERFNGFSD